WSPDVCSSDLDALVGPVGLGDDVKDADEDASDGLPEVEGGGGALEDLVGPAQVALDVGRRAVAAAEQGVRVGQDDRVVVDVDDAGVGRDLGGDGMGVVVVRDAGADVEELAQPALAGEEADDPPEEGPVE